MSVLLDPPGNEIRALLKAAGSFQDKRVLEIGCGDGRLTWLYAHQAGSIVGIDPDPDRIQLAQRSVPEELRQRVQLIGADLDEFYQSWQTQLPLERFDLTILSWSL